MVVNVISEYKHGKKKMDIKECQIKPHSVIDWFGNVLFLLIVQDESFRCFDAVVKFIYEQLKLLTQNKFDYLAEMIIFFFIVV